LSAPCANKVEPTLRARSPTLPDFRPRLCGHVRSYGSASSARTTPASPDLHGLIPYKLGVKQV